MLVSILALLPLALAQTTSSASSSATSSAAGSTITVSVGPGLIFNPESITANQGDTVVFEFLPQNHSIVQGDYSKPCQPSAGGFFSGFLPVKSGKAALTYNVQINDTNPIWVYCSQVTHCQGGMEMVINPPSTGGQSLQAYKDGSANAAAIGNPPAIAGGVFAPVGATSPSSASGASSASSATSASGSSSASSASSASAGASSATSTATDSSASSTSSPKSSASVSAKPSASTGAAPGTYLDRSVMGVTGLAALVFGGLLL